MTPCPHCTAHPGYLTLCPRLGDRITARQAASAFRVEIPCDCPAGWKVISKTPYYANANSAQRAHWCHQVAKAKRQAVPVSEEVIEQAIKELGGLA
jgi:hypothetical protein